jgi:anti-sigma B factor antagonist
MIIKSTIDAGNCLQVKLSGSLDLAGVEAVEMDFAALLAGEQHLLIDLTEVDFIASMGIRMLLSGAKQLNRRDLKLVLAAPNECVKEALEITNINSIIPVFDTIDQATAEL